MVLGCCEVYSNSIYLDEYVRQGLYRYVGSKCYIDYTTTIWHRRLSLEKT